MNVIMNEKGRQTKLLAAIAVLAMVICAFAVVIPSDISAAVGEEYTLEDGPVSVIDKDGNVVNGADGKPISTLGNALAQTSYAGQTWTLSAGTYNVTGGDTTSNYSALVIKQDGLTIQGAGIGQTTITNDKMTGSNAYTTGSNVTANQQATIVVDANNVTIKNVSVENTMIPQNEGYKCMEVFGSNTTIDTVSFELNSSAADDTTATSGVLINSTTDIGDTTITGCIFNNGLINIGYLNATGTLSIVDTVMNVESQGGFGISTYNPNEGSNNDAALDITEARNLEINVDASITNGGSLINMSPSGTTINVNESLTLSNDVTINTGVTVNIAAEKTVTAGTEVDVILEGRLAGAGKLNLNGNTMNVLPGSNYNSNNVTGGSITGSTTWQDVILEGTYDSYLNGKDNQKVTVVDDLVIGSNAEIYIAGQFIVNENATVTIKSGATIIIEDGATVTINGNVTIEGSDNGTTFAFGGKTMDVNGSITLDGANAFTCTGEVNIAGVFEISEGASAEFTDATVATGGELIVYGGLKGSVTNNGSITIDTENLGGTTSGYLTIEMGAADAAVDVINMMSGWVAIKDTDLTFLYKNDDKAMENNNEIRLLNVAGVSITEQVTFKNDTNGDRIGENVFVVSGNISPATGATGTATGSIFKVENGKAVLADSTAFNGISVEINGKLDVPVDVVATAENTKISGSGTITVTGSITMVSTETITVTTVNAVMYVTEATTAQPTKYNIYTTLENALAAGAKNITVYGEIDVDTSLTIPVGTTVEADNGAIINIGEDATVTVEAQDRSSGKIVDAYINVEGTLEFQNFERGNDGNTIVSDTSKESGDAMSFTNIYNALDNATDGETVTITKAGTGTDGYTVKLEKDVTVKDGVTLVVPSVNKLIVDNGVTLTIDGTMTVEGTLTIENKKDATATTAAEDAGLVTVNGMMKYLNDSDDFTTKIVGAYFYYDGYETITTLENAAAIVNEIDDTTISLYGEMTIGDVEFNYTGDYEMTLVANGKLTAGTITIDTLTFQAAAGSSVTATIALTNGSVQLDNIAGIEIADVASYDADNNATYTATVTGTVTAPQDDKVQGAEKGTVTVIGEVSSAANLNDVNVTVAVPVDSTLIVTAGPVNNVTVEGTLTATSNVTITNASVTGTVGTDNATLSIETLYAGVTAEEKVVDSGTRYVLTVGAGTAVIGEGVSVTKVAYVAPGTTVSETITDANGIKSTEYYVDDALFVTAYAAVDTLISNIEAPAEHAEFVEWQYDNNGKMTGVGKANIGQSDAFGKVYANINYNIYDIDVSACPGATVYIDGKEWNDYVVNGSIVLSGTLYAYGAHTITVYVAPGYEGTANITINGQAVTSGTFELTGDTEIVVTGITAIDYSQIGSGSSGSDGLGLTDYLLIILVVLIVIMAIMVAMRLMRS